MAPGSRIGHYRIISRLGGGGMGEVYLVQDEKLERPTALKLLPAGANSDSETIRRFTQEAKAAAALSHPNIAHIYDAGEHDGMPFLAMEYVEGQTLNSIAEQLPLSNQELLSIARQTADALVEAHSKGIIHRDIKPSNLIRDRRGQIKVLDFGLAKLSAAARIQMASSISSAAPTESGGSGKIAVGSLPYMSPEQALARDINGRTDIFSFGAVLYEIATGRRAFAGQTAAAVFDAILNRTPVAPRLFNPELSEALDRIIRKCLEKDPDLRYQTASDLLADLRLTERDESGARTRQAKSRFRRPGVMAGVALLVAMAAAGGWYVSRNKGVEPTEAARTAPLTSFPGSESQPSFSPDGNQVAFSWNQGKEDDLDLYIKVVEAGMPLRLTNTPASEYSPSWSPDGKYIAFLRQTMDSAGFYMIPALGGLERKLSEASPHRVGADAPFINWSPDGKQVVLVDRETPEAPLSIFLLDLEHNQRRRVSSPPAKTLGDSSPVYSPDGASIAFIRTGSLAVQDIYVLNLRDGKEKRLTTDSRRIYGITWNPLDGKILFSSARQARSRLWRIAPGGGTPEPVLGVGDQASFLTISRNGRRLAYTRSVIDTNIWRYKLPLKPVPAPEGEAIMSSTRYEQGPRYSPDGSRIVFSSNRSGALEIWLADSEGVHLNQLTNFNGPPTGSPMWSPDGKYIEFDSRPAGNPDVYVISADGGLPQRMTTEATEEIVPSWSRDGKWIYFASNRSGTFQIWKMPAQGGAASQVTQGGGFHGVESPDGKFVYYAKAAQNQPGLWRVPAGGGKEEPVIEALPPGYWSYWAFGKDGIYYVDREDLEGGGARYPLHFFHPPTRKDRVLTHLARRPFNSGLAVSPDGKWFLYTQVDQSETDIMMVDGFR
ncbi:MAG: PD40 domain-containing protein [Acidobacteria bacterium]|nr:PD40 domain-containing protein [Acidobacteriota bacterium]